MIGNTIFLITNILSYECHGQIDNDNTTIFKN